MIKRFWITAISILLISSFLTAAAKSQEKLVQFQTNRGDFTIILYPDKAPKTVENFLNYVNSGFYKNTLFHRVIPGFVVQAGGYDTTLTQKQTKAPILNEADNKLKNETWTLSMARTSDPNSATSQFFINLSDNYFLDFKSKSPQEYGYAVFGKVINGFSTIEAIAKTQTQQARVSGVPMRDVPVRPVIILDAKVITKIDTEN